MRALLLAAAVLFSFSAHAQAVKSGKKVQTVGNWTIYRSLDAMTDKPSCTGLWQDDSKYQLSVNGLYVVTSGGVESVTTRFNDEPADSFRMATKSEKDIRAVFVGGSSLGRLINSNRLRAQVGTLVDGVKLFDLDLTGIADAHNYIKNTCISAEAPVAATAPQDGPLLCPAPVIARMEKVGIPDGQIAQVCR